MWPILADLGVVKITAWGLGLALSFVLGSFVLWRILRSDYGGEELLSLWLWIVVLAWIGSGTWACSWFTICLPPLAAINGALLLTILATVWWGKKKKWDAWELLDTIGPITLAVGALAAIAWGPEKWLVALITCLGIILVALLRGMYRDFHWYKSGRVGFVGIMALGWWGLVQLVLANFDTWGLYSLGWITVSCVTALYIRSGRHLRQDFQFLWPRKKA